MNADGIDESKETSQEIPPPEKTDNAEDFDKSLDNERDKLADAIRSDDRFNEQADELSKNYSPDEIREMRDQLGDPSEVEGKYKDAVLGDHPEWSDQERNENIESAKSDWEGDAAAREVYGMALERQESPEGEETVEPPIIPGQVKENSESSSESEVTVEPPIIPNHEDMDRQHDDSPDQVAPVEPYHGFERGGREMTEEDKRAYGQTDEMIKEFTNEGFAERFKETYGYDFRDGPKK